MTEFQQHTKKPSSMQLSYLRDLAMRTGQSFAYPQTFGEASTAIRRLERAKPTSRAERRRERSQVRRDMAERRGDAARVRPGETRGWGSSASW
jgi:hypothetical protein